MFGVTKLGKGGFGTVYSAIPKKSKEKKVAIKVVNGSFKESVKEFFLTNEIECPTVLKLFEDKCKMENDKAIFSMELEDRWGREKGGRGRKGKYVKWL